MRYAPGDSASPDDVCDIYRTTPDGSYLIAEGVRFGSTVIDRWAPFGSEGLSYTICTRTADGDVDWAEHPYELEHDRLRFDWDGGSAEARWNVVSGDRWSKDFKRDVYLDGSSEGSWNDGVTRDGSLSVSLLRLNDSMAEEALREMAMYPGPVFVRTPHGLAYEANVTVDSMRVTESDGTIPVTFTANEIGCDHFVCERTDIMEAE